MMARRLPAFLLFVVFGNSWLAAQHKVDSTGEVYVLAGGGFGNEAFMQVGGGAEGTISRGIGLAVAGSVILSGNAWVMMASLGPLYQFNRFNKTVPFVTGGYSIAFPLGGSGGIHWGGGVIHWANPRWGPRLEARHYFNFSSSGAVVFRVGLAFR
jgi:hypothetical protein